jgi:hypothetical protein
MPKKKTKTIHVGLTEARKLGKSLFDYLTEDVKELSDVQYTYVIGYQDGIQAVLDVVKPFMEKLKQELEHMDGILKEDRELTKTNSEL